MSESNALRVEGLERRYLLAASIDNRVLLVDGTGGDDVISIAASGGGNVVVTINGDDDVFDDLDFDTIEVNAGGGDDRVSMGEGLTAPATLRGGAGDDTLQPSNSGREYLAGGDGNDSVEYVNATSSPYYRYFVGYY